MVFLNEEGIGLVLKLIMGASPKISEKWRPVAS